MKNDARVKITENLIKMMEEAKTPWEMPWYRTGSSLMPFNGSSKKRYNGVNILLLWSKAYETSEWRTFKQWKKIKANVRKGERGTEIVFWKPMTGRKEDESTGEERSYKWMLCKTYYVFNADQVDNYSPKIEKTKELVGHGKNRIKNLDRWVKKTLAKIEEKGNVACYEPFMDRINMPPFKNFKKQDCYYTTLFHELTHWTGHKDRMERDLTNRFGAEGYAMEDLVAELGSAFLAAHLGVHAGPREDHAKYLKSWIKTLKNDTNAIFTASTAADRAVQFMIDKVEGKVERKVA